MNRLEERINGMGPILRLVTPVISFLSLALLTVVMFILGNMNHDVEKLSDQFSNHLSHHVLLEKEYESRVKCLETRMEYNDSRQK